MKARYPTAFAANWRARAIGGIVAAAMLALYVGAFAAFDVPWSRLLPGLARLGWFVRDMVPPDPGGHFVTYVNALGETLAISLLGTLLGALMAAPLGFLAARNVVPLVLLRGPIKRLFDAVRGVDVLIWALIWINVVGLGPFAGVLAIAVADFGALGKLFAEIIESADSKPVEGVRAAGGLRLAEARFGLLPQVLPVMAGQVLYFIESNTRSATVIGVVGAGGIGLHLAEQIRVLEWRQVAFIILLVLVAVAAIDFVSGRLRAALAGRRTRSN
ncbi:MAG: phosphonate ABC transporter, permease protein PhnE [Hyphomicrobiales bacterium]|nr:phosphonate ABC transporter, permease protein PhnE [Hyphomicrobiales bacterium]MBV8663396.1 phosphonate ABC transporter, permease protein PhnE [Hyphomicrobiales bacterium]